MAEWRELATQVPRTALTVIDSSRPATTNTMISSIIVKPARRDRCGVEELSTDTSRKCRPAADAFTGKAHARRPASPTGPVHLLYSVKLQCIETYATMLRGITYRCYTTCSCNIRPDGVSRFWTPWCARSHTRRDRGTTPKTERPGRSPGAPCATVRLSVCPSVRLVLSTSHPCPHRPASAAPSPSPSSPPRRT